MTFVLTKTMRRQNYLDNSVADIYTILATISAHWRKATKCAHKGDDEKGLTGLTGLSGRINRIKWQD